MVSCLRPTTYSRYSRLLSLRLRNVSPLTLPYNLTRWLIMQKARRQPFPFQGIGLRPFVSCWFQVLFHSAPAVLFTFPSQYWSTIGHRLVFSLGGRAPLLQTGFHVSGPTQKLARLPSGFRLQDSHLILSAFPCSSTNLPVIFIASSITPTDKSMGFGSSLFARRY